MATALIKYTRKRDTRLFSPTSVGAMYSSNLLGSIDEEILVDVVEQHDHQLAADVTQQTIENGSVFSEHIVQKPRVVKIQFTQVNTNDGLERARSVWNKFLELWTQRSLVQVITEHEMYNNMAFSSISAIQQAPMKGSLVFSASLTQVNMVFIQKTLVTPNQLQNAVKATASSQVNTGTKNPSFVPKSIVGVAALKAALKFTPFGALVP